MIFVSVLTYSLGKEHGIRGAARELSRQLVSSDHDVLPCVRTIQRLRALDELMIYHGASTTLPKARSRAAHAALEAVGAELWCMIDDDVETDLTTLARLVAIAHAGKVAVLPCAVRSVESDQRINIVFDGSLYTQVPRAHAPELAGVPLAGGDIPIRAVTRAGCGLMIVPRAALERVRDEYSDDLTYVDDDGARRVALFAPMFLTAEMVGADAPPIRIWLGEDYSFCERLRAAGVEIAAPAAGRSMHDGVALEWPPPAEITP